jgi:adenylate cyclase class 2
MAHIEREIKIKVISPSFDELEKILRSKYTFVEEESQRDIYYNSPIRDFRTTDEALRLREDNGKYYITYKGPKISSMSKSRLEIEVEIADLDPMAQILEKLGFVRVLTVEKIRKKFKYKNFTILLDYVKNLGNFIEIEAIDTEEKNLLDFVDNFLKENNIVGEKTLKSYLELLIERLDKKTNNSNID